jgi:hypothetical protein
MLDSPCKSSFSPSYLLKHTHWRRLVIDEYHSLSSRTAKLGTLFFDTCWLLTATPGL